MPRSPLPHQKPWVHHFLCLVPWPKICLPNFICISNSAVLTIEKKVRLHRCLFYRKLSKVCCLKASEKGSLFEASFTASARCHALRLRDGFPLTLHNVSPAHAVVRTLCARSPRAPEALSKLIGRAVGNTPRGGNIRFALFVIKHVQHSQIRAISPNTYAYTYSIYLGISKHMHMHKYIYQCTHDKRALRYAPFARALAVL